MRRLLTGLTVGGALLATTTLPAFADPAPIVGGHQHYLDTPGGNTVLIGPKVCDNEQALMGFSQFHGHVHRGTPGQEVFNTEANPTDHPVDFSVEGCPSAE